MKMQTTNEFVKEINQIFFSLARKLKLTGPITVNFQTSTIGIYYIGKYLGIEFYFELAGFSFTTIFFNNHNMALPLGEKDSNGKLQRISLKNILRKLNVYEEEKNKLILLHKLESEHNSNNYKEMMELTMSILEKHWDTIVLNVNKIFV